MHRSGTSAVSRVLNLLGAKLPDRLVGAEPGNERGHWEPASLVEIDDEILAATGSAWDDASPFDMADLRTPAGRGFRARILRVLETEYGNGNLLLVKDPRISRLLPFWLDALEEYGVDPRVILPIRNPVEVAQSLASRDRMLPAFAHFLWARYVLDAEYHSRGVPRSVIEYEALLVDWRNVIGEVGGDLGIDLSYDAEIARKIDEFLTGDLRHHRKTVADLRRDSTASPLLVKAYEAVLQLAEKKPVGPQVLDDLRAELDRPSVEMASAAKDELVARRRALRELTQNLLVSRQEVDFFRPRTEELEKLLYAEQVRANKEAEGLHNRIHDAEARINDLGGELTRVTEGSLARDQRIAVLEEMVHTRDRRIEALETRLNAREAALAHYRKAAARLQERWERRFSARLTNQMTRVSRRLLRIAPSKARS
jgi:predicted  nucleic acid-binding Zn-ribbon protein